MFNDPRDLLLGELYMYRETLECILFKALILTLPVFKWKVQVFKAESWRESFLCSVREGKRIAFKSVPVIRKNATLMHVHKDDSRGEEKEEEEEEDDTSEESLDIQINTPTLDQANKVSRKFVVDLIEFYKAQHRLPTATVQKIVKDAKEFFQKQPSLIDIELGRDDVINICGDIHGQFYDLCKIFDTFGMPSEENQYLFNGDFVDRGVWSTEVLMLLLSMKLLHPRHFFLARGNHECEQINRFYGFESEALSKYDSRTYALIQEVFNWLPLAHCVNRSVLVMHGGLPRANGVTLEQIRQVSRGKPPDREGIMCDLLWADPQDEEGVFPNPRGPSIMFGPDVTERFLHQNNLLYIIRSHECVQYGYDLCHDDKVVTVFSAPNYCDKHSNKAAVCILHGDDVSMPEFRRFDAAPHPKVEPIKYSTLLMKFGMLRS